MFLGTLKTSSWLKLLLGEKHLLESIHDMLLRGMLLGLLTTLNLSLCHVNLQIQIPKNFA